MREANNETYFDTKEVETNYNWGSSTLYYFRSLGLIKNYRFRGDKKAYWPKSQLEAIKNMPPEERTPSPKSHAPATQGSGTWLNAVTKADTLVTAT